MFFLTQTEGLSSSSIADPLPTRLVADPTTAITCSDELGTIMMGTGEE